MQPTEAGELRELLNRVCEARRIPPQAAIRLEHILQEYKPKLVKLLDDPPKNSQHRSTIESGKAIINTIEYKINKEFTKEAIFLSDHLNLDEYESSRLLLEGTRRTNKTFAPAVDTAIYLYHTERDYVLTILNTILESINDHQIDKHIRCIFLDFMVDIYLKEADSFVSKILKSLQNMNTAIKTINKDTMSQQVKLCEGTLSFRISQLNEERILLAQVLYHIASLLWLSEADVLSLIDTVRTTTLLNPTAPYLLVALLAVISPKYLEDQSRHGTSFWKNQESMKKMHEAIVDKEWKVDGVKGAVLLQWSMFNARVRGLGISSPFKLDEQSTTSLLKKGIELDAFGFLNQYLLHFKQENGTSPDMNKVKESSDGESTMVIDGLTVDPSDYSKFYADIAPEFQLIVVHQLEYFAELFILRLSSQLHQLKTEEEDAIYQVGYSNDAHTDYVKDSAKKQNLEAFLTLLASIYRGHLNAGNRYWKREHGLFAFVKWLFDLKVVGTVRAAFDFLASISTGDECASYAYEVLSMGTSQADISNSHLFSWGKLFATLQFYAAEIYGTLPGEECPSIPETEEQVLCSLLHLCQQVVQYSSTARIAIWEDRLLRPHESIVRMISCPTSVDLRARLYSLLAAFCSSWGGGINGIGKRISIEVWSTLEISDLILSDKRMVAAPTVTPPSTTATETFLGSLASLNAPEPVPVANNTLSTPATRFLLPDQSSGFLIEFDSEKNSMSYTRTLSILKLMASLIHKQSEKDILISGYSMAEPSIPPCLGSEHRSPGTAPYLSLVIDHIFLSLNNLQFTNPNNKWQLTDACLKVVENSIMSFDLEPLCDHVNQLISQSSGLTVGNEDYMSILRDSSTPQLKPFQSGGTRDALIAYITHPGFDVMVRILSGGSLVNELYRIICLNGNRTNEVQGSRAKRNHYFRTSLTRCLRIIHKAMTIQNAFVSVLLPQLNMCSEKLPAGELKLGSYVFPQVTTNLTSVGRTMLFNTQIITQIALLVSDESEEISILSINILRALALQPNANPDKVQFPNYVNLPMGGIGQQLPGILSSSHEAASIILGISERLDVESMENISYDNYNYDINTIPFWRAEKTLGYDYSNEDEDVLGVTHQYPSIRIAILDMLISSLHKDQPSPTLSEFLLGYDVQEIVEKGSQQKSILTSYEQDTRLSCLFSILNILRTYNSQQSNSLKQGQNSVEVHPLVAEKCYYLLHQLCSRESTSTATLHYIRANGDDLLVNQLRFIVPRVDTSLVAIEQHFAGTIKYAAGNGVQTDFFTLKSMLNQRAWLLKLLALELHVRKTTGTASLLESLYGHDTYSSLDVTNSLSDRFGSLRIQMSGDYQQPHWNLLEITSSLEFYWQDHNLGPASVDITKNYFKDFKPKDYETDDLASHCKLFDIRSVYKYLRQTQKEMLSRGTIPEQEIIAIEEEMGNILQTLMAENRSRQIKSSRLRCLQAWKQLVEVSLLDCFDSLSRPIREKIAYDLLSTLWNKLEEESYQERVVLRNMSELIVVLLARLKTDNDTSTTYLSLPNERLRQTFYGIIQFICKRVITIDIRSNLYIALVIFLQYIDLSNYSPGNLQLLEIIDNETQERVLDILCNDAVDAWDTHKDAAIVAIQSLYVLFQRSKRTSIHSYLANKNMLHLLDTSAIQANDTILIP
ncbi:uncharacterized protein RHIMIDRAFT_312136 [Rhizopus microsporus ATCC 52813]|uniref:Uncharacterized protein n=1 Tax=Rhizopus microsporus ATCC 52813 TaxID=1340429 RepID=A0A2G4T1V3_RHIZD|nr:uncharacterized protein RHIMIDRAFT_312136 [Rhizopus microsporus ATCC 52813]PHZ14984.1 hypothetical protein RHIMIDRAFT_312136 [Rhizopus microsporus ATCC 52813]